MTHIDDSLALTVPTSDFFAGPVSTDDRPILNGIDRMEIIIFFIILIVCQRDLDSSDDLVHDVKLIPSNL